MQNYTYECMWYAFNFALESHSHLLSDAISCGILNFQNYKFLRHILWRFAFICILPHHFILNARWRTYKVQNVDTSADNIGTSDKTNSKFIILILQHSNKKIKNKLVIPKTKIFTITSKIIRDIIIEKNRHNSASDSMIYNVQKVT